MRNADFYPLRTPTPCIAIRHMVPTDLAFMSLDKYPVALRRQLLTAFLGVFSASIKASERDAVDSAQAMLAALGGAS